MNLVLKVAFLVVFVLAVAQVVNSECKSECRCKLMRDCAGSDPEVHYNFMPEEWAVKVAGRRNYRKQDAFCNNICVNLLKVFLGDGFNYTIEEKPDEVVLDAFMVDIGYHRVCQRAKSTIENCDFSLESRSGCGKRLTTRYIGNTGCVVFQHGVAPDDITLKFAADVGNQMIAYMDEMPMLYAGLLLAGIQTATEL